MTIVAEEKNTLCPIVPKNQRIVVSVEEQAKTTPGGLVLPQNMNKERPVKGTVIAVSDDHGEDKTPPCKRGDTVIYRKYAGDEVSVTFGPHKRSYLLVEWSSVIGVLKSE